MGSKGRGLFLCSFRRIPRLYVKSEKKRNSVAVVSKKRVFCELDKGKKSDAKFRKKISAWKSNASRTVKGDIKVVIRQNDMGRNAKNMKDMAFSFHF